MKIPARQSNIGCFLRLTFDLPVLLLVHAHVMFFRHKIKMPADQMFFQANKEKMTTKGPHRISQGAGMTPHWMHDRHFLQSSGCATRVVVRREGRSDLQLNLASSRLESYEQLRPFLTK